MTFQLFLRIMKAHWLLMGVVVTTCLAVGLTLYLLHPKEYTSDVALVVTSYPQSSLSSNSGAANPSQGPGANSYMLTQKDIIMSRPVAAEALKRLGGGAKATNRNEPKVEVSPSAISHLQKHLGVEFAGGGQGGSVIRVGYTSSNPHRAASVANAVASAYLKTKLRLQTRPIIASLPWYASQVTAFSKRLESAQAALAKYKAGHHIVGANPSSGGLPTQRLTTLSQEYALAQIKAQQAKEQAQEMRRMWRNHRDPASIPGVMESGIVQQIRAQLMVTQAQAQAMSSQLGENNPRYQQAEQQVAQLKARYQRAVASVIQGQVNDAQVSEAKAQSLQQQLNEQQNEVLQTQGGQVTLPLLIGKVEAAQQAYSGMLKLYNQQLLRSQMQSTNVSILNDAEAPLSPSTPKLKVYGVASLGLGILLAVGAALLLELIRPKVRSRDDIEQGLELKLLGDMRGE